MKGFKGQAKSKEKSKAPKEDKKKKQQAAPELPEKKNKQKIDELKVRVAEAGWEPVPVICSPFFNPIPLFSIL